MTGAIDYKTVLRNAAIALAAAVLFALAVTSVTGTSSAVYVDKWAADSSWVKGW